MKFEVRLNRDVPEVVQSEEIVGTCGGCEARWTGEAVCHCATCHLTFTTVTGFDKHRIGPVGEARCRTGNEMREVGYEPNEDGQWRRPGFPDLPK